jgi:hypothetical protein
VETHIQATNREGDVPRMNNVTEVALVVKHWLTLEDDIGENEEDLYVDLGSEPDIETAKQGLNIEIESVREQFGSLLLETGGLEWLYKDNPQLEMVLPEWFLPGSNDEYYLEEYATTSRTDVRQVLNFLTGRLALWARGEGRPKENPEYDEETWPYGTQYYKYDGEQWLYSPVPSGEGTDWQPMDYWTEAAGGADEAQPDAIDLSTPEAAQEAADEVVTAALQILGNVYRNHPESVGSIDPARARQLALAALTNALA